MPLPQATAVARHVVWQREGDLQRGSRAGRVTRRRGPLAIGPLRAECTAHVAHGSVRLHPFREPRLDVGPPPANRGAPDLDRRRKLAGAAQAPDGRGRQTRRRAQMARADNGGRRVEWRGGCGWLRLHASACSQSSAEHWRPPRVAVTPRKKTWHPPRVAASGGDYLIPNAGSFFRIVSYRPTIDLCETPCDFTT